MASIHKRIVLPLSALKQGISRFDFILEPPELPEEEGRTFPEPVEAAITVQNMTGEFLVEIRAESKGLFVCDRCSEEFRKPISGELKILYTTDPEMAEDEKDDEVRYLTASASEVDLTQDVVDALLLAMPSKLICRDGCQGLCPGCGANLNEESCSCENESSDPRWDGLKNLTFDE